MLEIEQVASSAVEEVWPIFFTVFPGIAGRQVFIGCVRLKHKQITEKCLCVCTHTVKGNHW